MSSPRRPRPPCRHGSRSPLLCVLAARFTRCWDATAAPCSLSSFRSHIRYLGCSPRRHPSGRQRRSEALATAPLAAGNGQSALAGRFPSAVNGRTRWRGQCFSPRPQSTTRSPWAAWLCPPPPAGPSQSTADPGRPPTGTHPAAARNQLGHPIPADARPSSKHHSRAQSDHPAHGSQCPSIRFLKQQQAHLEAHSSWMSKHPTCA